MDTEQKPLLWYYAQNGQAIGPIPLSSIEALAKAGQLSTQTLVWRDGEEDWKPISSIMPGTLGQTAEITPPPSVTPPPLPAPISATVKRPWRDMKRFMLPLLVLNAGILFIPVSLVLLWKGNAFNQRGKIVATIVSLVFFVYAQMDIRRMEQASRDEFASQKTQLLSTARSELEKGNAAPALVLKSRFSGAVKDADLQVLITEAEAMQSAKNTESKRQQDGSKVDAGSPTNESPVASTPELRRLGKQEIEVLLPEVESLANELEGFLADIQGGSPVTLEMVGKINSWKYGVQSKRKILRDIEIPIYTASNSLFLAVDLMNLAWKSFEEALNEQNPSKKAELAVRHASNLKYMREHIKGVKDYVAEGKY